MSPDGQSIVTGAGDESLRYVLYQYLQHKKYLLPCLLKTLKLEIFSGLILFSKCFLFYNLKE